MRKLARQSRWRGWLSCCQNMPAAVAGELDRMWESIGPRLDAAALAVISGASGVEPTTSEERRFLEGRGNIAVRATGSHLGHGPEAQFLMNIALAAIAASHGRLFLSVPASSMLWMLRCGRSRSRGLGIGGARDWL
jgi:hypothetical protein